MTSPLAAGTIGRVVGSGASLILLLTAVVVAIGYQLPTETAKRLAAEGGPIENVSLALLAFGLAVCVRALVRERSRPWLSGTLVMLMLLLRELDFHRMFTPKSIDSTGFYRSAAIPLHVRLLVPVLALPFIVATCHVLWMGLRGLADAIRHRQGWVLHAALALAMVGLARYAEKSGRDPADVVEEVAEVAFAALVLLIALAFAASARAAARPQSRGG